MARHDSFDDLIGAIQNAFLRCNALSEKQHIEMLSQYFDENGPICMDMQMPFFSEDGNEVQYKELKMPKLCLVPISTLKLEEICVDFKVRLDGKIALQEDIDVELDDDGDDKDTRRRFKLQKFTGMQNKVASNSYLGYVQGGGPQREPNSYANISLKFTSQDPPEGLMRIQDELVKITI